MLIRPSFLRSVLHFQYLDGERVEVKVNKLTSTVTQLPRNYYDLAFCKPETLTYKVENIGEVLHGSMIQNSPYELYMGKSDFKVLCKADLTKAQAADFAKRIRQDYRVQMIMDNLPAATRMISEQPDGKTVTMYEFLLFLITRLYNVPKSSKITSAFCFMLPWTTKNGAVG